jgi:dipeptidyl aminopeptidase/acylaminoacyl peptidase
MKSPAFRLPRRVLRVALVSILALLPLTLVAQGTTGRPVQRPAPPKPETPQSADDLILEQQSYVTPPPELTTAVLAPRYLNVSLTNPNKDRTWFLDEIGDAPVPMAIFSKPFHELGGLFIDFKANRSRTLTIRNNAGIQIISAADGTRRKIQTPPGARVSNATWSPDGKSIAFFVHTDTATQIWLADAATGQSHQLTQTPVLATLDTSFDFTADGKSLVTVLVPDGRAPMPVEPAAPTGPEVKLTTADKNHLRTFASLMTTPYQFTLLEWDVTGQAAEIDVATRAVTRIGKPAMIRSIDPSPDGTYLRVTQMVKPFSYIVPVSNFGSVEQIWDTSGKVLATLNDRPLNLGVQADDAQAGGGRGGRGGADEQGRREITWRADAQGLSYLEQEPAPAGARENAAGGGGAGTARGAGGGRGRAGRGGASPGPARKDRVMQWLPPFDAASTKVVYENDTRMSNHRFSPDMQALFFREASGQNTIDYAVYLDDPTHKYELTRFRTSDFYANPGTLVSTRGTAGGGGRGGGGGFGGRGGGGGAGPVLLSADKSSVFYEGTLYNKDPEAAGPKTFIDKVAIKTGEKARIYESDNNGVFERVTTIVDPDAVKLVVSRESPTDVPQNYLVEGSTRKQLTNNEDIAPDLTHAPKQRFFVDRADGFRFKVTVTLPPGYKEGTRLPAIFWFYPREYDNQEAYDQPDRTYDKNAFINYGTRSMQFFVRLGYAVVEPDAPIVGPENVENNNYVNDLRNDLSATIDELDRRGLIDRTRLAIGGHSYGAFSTVNAMVHTPFFKAGIAGDGNYIRLLTPLGFQNERRDFWDARDVYLDMSPFVYANHLNGALLMYHGLGDQNVGTDPINSIRMFHALNGLGKTAALYLYPLEDHGPAARETLLDLWARWAAWLDKYVKNPQKGDTKPAPEGGGGGGF